LKAEGVEPEAFLAGTRALQDDAGA
jgi:hypothetical protein